jgi:hypothetical protein
LRFRLPSYRFAASLAAAVALALAFASAATPAALAAHDQSVTFEAPRDLLNPQVRPHALAQLQQLGVHALRLVLYWRDVAPDPDSANRPNFDATDPAQYHWGQYDALIAAAQQLNWSVLLTVSGPVPRWATATHHDNLTRPSPLEFQHFMTAVGRQYGHAIALWSIWNEPNHPQFLLPQYVRGVPASPMIYRGLFEAGYAGLQAAGISNPQVLMGETAPTGTGHDVAPLVFLRGALCLTSSYRKPSTCAALPAAGYAHHAYTKPAGPFYRPPSPDDVTIGVLSRLVRALDRAAAAGALPAHLPIYLTEFGVQSKPNRFLGVPVAKQAEFDAIAERIAYDNPRVKAFSQYLLRDDPLGGKPGSGATGGFIGFQSGLEYVNGQPKPIYAGFRTPLTVSRRHGGFSLWGLVRPAGGVTHVAVLVQDSGSHSYRVLAANVTTNAMGYWRLSSGDRRGQRWRVRWTAPGGAVFTGPPIRAY